MDFGLEDKRMYTFTLNHEIKMPSIGFDFFIRAREMENSGKIFKVLLRSKCIL